MVFQSLLTGMFLRRLPQCRRHFKYFCTNNTRTSQLHSLSTLISNGRLRYAVGGLIGASTITALIYTQLQPSKARELSPSSFAPSTLISSEDVGKNSKLIRLKIPLESIPQSHLPQSTWAFYVKDSDIQVERPYTPLEGLSDSGDVVFWVKKYPHGEVGRWLHSKTVGEQVELRGPDQTWLWHEGAWDNVIMIGGGTGIAPFYQLLHGLFSVKDFTTKTSFRLIHSHRASELPPEFMLKNLTTWANHDPERLRIETFVDTLDPSATADSLKKGKISRECIESALKDVSRQPGKTIILVCGPESMINELAGPKGRDNSQGSVGGVLGRIRGHKFEVFKL